MNGTASGAASSREMAASLESSQAEMADLLVAYLEQIGVEYVFGVPGGAIEPVFNAMARSERRGSLRVVVARHESGAAFMAEGYAYETGRLGVCCATSGPGSTNLITGVACAHENNVPLLAISGLPAAPSCGRGALQESSSNGVDAVAMFRHCTRYNSLISHPAQFERKLSNAIMTAFHASGAATHLAIPLDVQRHPLDSAVPSYNLAAVLRQSPSLIDESAIQAVKDELQRAPRVVFLIGMGCNGAMAPIMELIELTRALFVTTPDAKGLVNPRHPAYCGVFGFGGHRSADALLDGLPEALVALGTGFGEFVSGGWSDALLNSRLVHIDDSEDNLMRSPMAQLHVRGSILLICRRLVELIRAEGTAEIDKVRAQLSDVFTPQVTLQNVPAYLSDSTPIKPQRLMKTISERCPPDTRFFADMGNAMLWTTHYLQPHDRRFAADLPPPGAMERRVFNPNWFRVIMDFCSMGWALGAAVGAARGNPDCPVVSVIGDGAYLMSGQEITVAAMEGLTVVYVVLNDGALGMVMHGQRLAKAEATGFELPQVDYAKLVQAMGIPGYRVDTPAELDALDFAAIFARKGPSLIDVRIDREEVPPMVLRMKTLGTLK